MKRKKFKEGSFYNLIQKFTEERVLQGYTLEDVASECRVTVQTVRNFENQKCFNPKLFAWYSVLYSDVHGSEQLDYMLKYVFEE